MRFTAATPATLATVPFAAWWLTREARLAPQDATLELKVKTVKYFKGLMKVHSAMGVDNMSCETPSAEAAPPVTV
jgi:hypothetical protein